MSGLWILFFNNIRRVLNNSMVNTCTNTCSNTYTNLVNYSVVLLYN